MTQMQLDQLLILIAAIASTLFALGWMFFAPWHRTETGRAFVLSEISLAILLDLSVISNRWHWTVPKDAVTALLVFIAVAACLRLLLVRLQIRPWFQSRQQP